MTSNLNVCPATNGQLVCSGLLIFRGKKVKFHGIFKGKFAEKSADFAGFSREKSQNSKDFQGQILRKSYQLKNIRFLKINYISDNYGDRTLIAYRPTSLVQ